VPQFTIHRNRNPQSKTLYPLLLDVQSELLEDLPTRTVIPLTQSPSLTQRPLNRLTPFIPVESKPYMLLTYQLASIPRSVLGPQVSDASAHSDTIIAALDFLVTGV